MNINKFFWAAALALSLPSALLAQPFGTGLNFDDEAYEQAPLKAPLVRSLYNLPRSASLKDFSPIPKSQGDYGTCVGWASAYAARTIIEAQKQGWTNRTTITENAYSPGFLYHYIKDDTDRNCEFGSNIDDAMTTMEQMGVPLLRDYSQDCPSSIPRDITSRALQHTIRDYAKLFSINDAKAFKISATKKSLAEGKPVVIGMNCPNSFYEAEGVWEPNANPNTNHGGHAMCVIGYDDDKYGGAFEIMNSWGDDWGNDGYIWVRYDDYAAYTKYAYEIIEQFDRPTDDQENDLAGQVRFVMPGGGEMGAIYREGRYQMRQPYPSGTRFRLMLSNNEPAYVYAFGSDATQQIFDIFPHAPNISPALTYSQNDVAIPDEDHYIEMDNTVGTDFLCVLYSKEPLDIEAIKAAIGRASGNFHTRVDAALGAKRVALANISFSQTSIGFQAKSQGASVVAIVVETKHVK